MVNAKLFIASVLLKTSQTVPQEHRGATAFFGLLMLGGFYWWVKRSIHQSSYLKFFNLSQGLRGGHQYHPLERTWFGQITRFIFWSWLLKPVIKLFQHFFIKRIADKEINDPVREQTKKDIFYQAGAPRPRKDVTPKD